ncbi:MAG: tRNA pseudouridine(38-40) synthase TruA [bacterium]
MNRYFVKLAFDGTNYHGWQIQQNARTVQQALNDAFSLILREPVRLTGCGRTDTGVHASEFFAHVDLARSLSEEERTKLVFKLNGYLDEDLVIHSIFPVKPRLHARFSAKQRTYQYRITRTKNPFLTKYSYYLYGYLDVELMNKGAEFLLSVTDFTSFSKVNSDTKTNICKVFSARWEPCEHELVFTIRADRFLRNMVRAIVGTLLELGSGKITFDEFRQIVHSHNRSNAGDSVPAAGLFLVEVVYADGIELEHR